MADQPLFLQLGEGGELNLDRPFARRVNFAHNAVIDHVQRLKAEVAQVVVNRALELLGRNGGVPRGVVAAHRADLGDDRQTRRIGMQRLADDLIDDVRAVKVAGVDVIDAACDRFAQHGDRFGAIFRRPEHMGPASCIAP